MTCYLMYFIGDGHIFMWVESNDVDIVIQALIQAASILLRENHTQKYSVCILFIYFSRNNYNIISSH